MAKTKTELPIPYGVCKKCFENNITRSDGLVYVYCSHHLSGAAMRDPDKGSDPHWVIHTPISWAEFTTATLMVKKLSKGKA